MFTFFFLPPLVGRVPHGRRRALPAAQQVPQSRAAHPGRGQPGGRQGPGPAAGESQPAIFFQIKVIFFSN